MFTFVTGGLRSGKSEYGLRRASELGPPPWLYVAPHIEGDDELKARLARHRRDQEAAWRLLEAPTKLAATLQPETLAGHGAAVIDRFTIWLSNRLNASERPPTTTWSPRWRRWRTSSTARRPRSSSSPRRLASASSPRPCPTAG